MCVGCHPAVTALFCLWVQSGFNKAKVAGALTFFPPDPAYYKFKRTSADGKELPDDDDENNDESQRSLNKSQSFDDESTAPSEDELSQKSNNSVSPTVAERSRLARKRAKRRKARDKRDAALGVTYSLMLDPRLRSPMKFSGTIESLKIYNAKAKSYLAVVVYRQKKANCKTIIYSHGNATDIGAMSMMQSIMARNLNANIVMYDYSGYGESGGMALEKNTYYDIQTVYEYCVENLADKKPENLVIYGESVGSGPSCYLCSKREVGGLILHSPFTSGMRVLTQSRALACLDIFPNIDRIKKVKCPVMVIHGRKDEKVRFAHGAALHEAVPQRFKREPWWVPNRGHNDICEGGNNMSIYLRRLQNFLTSLDEKEKVEVFDDDVGYGCGLCLAN